MRHICRRYCRAQRIRLCGQSGQRRDSGETLFWSFWRKSSRFCRQAVQIPASIPLGHFGAINTGSLWVPRDFTVCSFKRVRNTSCSGAFACLLVLRCHKGPFPICAIEFPLIRPPTKGLISDWGSGRNATVEPLTSCRRTACHDDGDMRTSAKDLVLNPAQPKGGETR